jgi:biopolymer transport protein ExbD
MKLLRRETKAEIPTSSMADIAFLEEQQRETEQEEAVFIKIAPDGSILVDCKAMEHEEILDYLEPKLTRDAEKPVILYTDAYAPYQAMMSIYDILIRPEVENNKAADKKLPPPWEWKVKNISVPTQTEVQEYIEIFGYNPFESQCEG